MTLDKIQVQVRQDELVLSGEILYFGSTTNLVGVKTTDLEKLESWGHCYSLGWRTASMIRAELLKSFLAASTGAYFEEYFEKVLAPLTDTTLFKWYPINEIRIMSSLEIILKELEEDVER